MGIFILLAFLGIKSTSLFAADQKLRAISCCATPACDDGADAEKENKQFEIADEELMGQAIVNPKSFVFSNKPAVLTVSNIIWPYLSLPYPPPNGSIAAYPFDTLPG